ncbi:hypothetical protein ACWGDT_36805 [Streptomyces avermitilis]
MAPSTKELCACGVTLRQPGPLRLLAASAGAALPDSAQLRQERTVAGAAGLVRPG